MLVPPRSVCWGEPTSPHLVAPTTPALSIWLPFLPSLSRPRVMRPRRPAALGERGSPVAPFRGRRPALGLSAPLRGPWARGALAGSSQVGCALPSRASLPDWPHHTAGHRAKRIRIVTVRMQTSRNWPSGCRWAPEGPRRPPQAVRQGHSIAPRALMRERNVKTWPALRKPAPALAMPEDSCYHQWR